LSVVVLLPQCFGLQNRCEQRPCSGGFDSRPPPRTDTRTNRGRDEVWLDASPRLDQDLFHHRVQQSLELLGSAVGHGPLDPAPNIHEDVTSCDCRGRLALCFQSRPAGCQRLHLLVKCDEAVRAGRLGQPLGLEGSQIPVASRTPFLEGGLDAGQFGLAAGVLGVPGLPGTLGGRLEMAPSSSAAKVSLRIASSNGPAGRRSWSQRAVPCRWREKQV
jgi:hypothetical protein